MCPVCGRALNWGNHVQGTVLSADGAGAVVELLISCRGCLSVLRGLRRHDASGHTSHDGAVTCALPGARAYREIERLRESGEDWTAAFTEIAADPERRFLLRVREVFAVVRARYRHRVRLIDDAVCGWRASDTASGIPWPPLIRWERFGREVTRAGRVFANPFAPADRERGEPLHGELGDDHFLLLPAGSVLRIHQAAENVLLLLGPEGEPMAAGADLCLPEAG